MKKTSTPKYVTEVTFKKETAETRQRFDQIDQRFERLETSVGRLTLSTLRNEADIREMKETLMTREMGQSILTHLEGLTRAYREAENSTRIHLNQLTDFRPRMDDHEKRIAKLESQIQAG